MPLKDDVSVDLLISDKNSIRKADRSQLPI